MQINNRRVLFSLLSIALVCIPSVANAAMNFMYYTLGGGMAMYDIMNSVSLMMRSSGFKVMLTSMGVLGIIIMGARSMANGGRHLHEFFAYAVLVGLGMRAATSILIPVFIVDVNGTQGNPQLYKIDQVPIVVGAPMSLITSAGHRATELIEIFFGTASGSTAYSDDGRISKGASFNLMGRFLEDGNKIVITDPRTRMTLNAFVTDCVIPSVALGYLSLSDIQKAPKLISVLAQAQNGALFTRDYYATGPGGGTTTTFAGSIQTCGTAYTSLTTHMTAEATAILSGSAISGFRSGAIAIPMSAYISSGVGLLNLSSASNGGYSAQDYIMQKAFLNSMNGAFRNAAVQTGNNELLTAVAIEQAEASQKNTWFSARVLFENLMPYLYIVLQAFMLAVIPLCILLLFLPGFGSGIAINLIQMCLWLALWEPMFAILNYILILFGSDSVVGPISQSAGLTLANTTLLTEQTNMLILAGGFFGTMIPLIAWGLVNKGMAFTQFISSGVGSGFASQAGATAASGNLSMGNVSMNNTSANKFDSMSKASVGTAAVTAQMGAAGAALGIFDHAGSQGLANGASTNVSRTDSETLSKQKAYQKATSYEYGSNNTDQAAAMNNFTRAIAQGGGKTWSQTWSDNDGNTWSFNNKHGARISQTDREGKTVEYALKVQNGEVWATDVATQSSFRVSFGANASTPLQSLTGVGVTANATASSGITRTGNHRTQNGVDKTESGSESRATDKTKGDDRAHERLWNGLTAFQQGITGSDNKIFSDTRTGTKGNSHTVSQSIMEAAKRVQTATDTSAHQLQSTTQVTHTDGYMSGQEPKRIENNEVLDKAAELEKLHDKTTAQHKRDNSKNASQANRTPSDQTSALVSEEKNKVIKKGEEGKTEQKIAEDALEDSPKNQQQANKSIEKYLQEQRDQSKPGIQLSAGDAAGGPPPIIYRDPSHQEQSGAIGGGPTVKNQPAPPKRTASGKIHPQENQD